MFRRGLKSASSILFPGPRYFSRGNNNINIRNKFGRCPRWFSAETEKGKGPKYSPEMMDELKKIIDQGKLSDIGKLPEELRNQYGEETLREAVEEFEQAQKRAEKRSTAENFIENLQYVNEKDEELERKLDEETREAANVPFWLGMMLMMFVAAQHYFDDSEIEQRKAPRDRMWTAQTVERLKYFPTRYFSQLWGSFTGYEFPLPIQRFLNWMYARFTGCHLEEAEKDISEYRSLQQWFQRRLKPGMRPIDESALLISPVDGRVVHYGFVDEDEATIEQVKGVSYSLKDFVGADSPLFDVIKKMKETQGSNPETNLYYCVLYLAPGDYHGYHSPVEWTIEQRVHFPGHLFPVAAWAVRFIRDLFPLNERVVLTGKWKHGFFAYAPVGAYNVGSIELNFEPELKTNLSNQTAASDPSSKTYSPNVTMKKGDNIGFFNLGSSIVMIFEAPHQIFKVARGEKVRLGQALTQQLTPELARAHIKRLEERREQVEQEMVAQLEKEVEAKKAMARFLERMDRSKSSKQDS